MSVTNVQQPYLNMENELRGKRHYDLKYRSTSLFGSEEPSFQPLATRNYENHRSTILEHDNLDNGYGSSNKGLEQGDQRLRSTTQERNWPSREAGPPFSETKPNYISQQQYSPQYPPQQQEQQSPEQEIYFPFGTPGGGAPNRDTSGRALASIRTRRNSDATQEEENRKASQTRQYMGDLQRGMAEQRHMRMKEREDRQQSDEGYFGRRPSFSRPAAEVAAEQAQVTSLHQRQAPLDVRHESPPPRREIMNYELDNRTPPNDYYSSEISRAAEQRARLRQMERFKDDPEGRRQQPQQQTQESSHTSGFPWEERLEQGLERKRHSAQKTTTQDNYPRYSAQQYRDSRQPSIGPSRDAPGSAFGKQHQSSAMANIFSMTTNEHEDGSLRGKSSAYSQGSRPPPAANDRLMSGSESVASAYRRQQQAGTMSDILSMAQNEDDDASRRVKVRGNYRMSAPFAMDDEL